MKLEEIIGQLKAKGCRSTKLRHSILEIMLNKDEPISIPELIAALNKKGFKPNQSTVYRQLETLQKNDIAESVLLDPKVQLFELKKHHHHHFVCQGCKDVKDVHSEEVESAFHKFERELQSKGLSINKHELTFFGQCQACH